MESVVLQGQIRVAVQELDGTFTHTFNLEENCSKVEISCHSKSRRYNRVFALKFSYAAAVYKFE